MSVNQVNEQEAQRHSVKPKHGLRRCALSSAVINPSALSESNGFWEWRKDRDMEEEGERATTHMDDLCVGVCARIERSGRKWCQHVDAAVITLGRAYLNTFSQDAGA